MRHVQGLNGQEHIALVQDLVVLQVVHQRMWHHALVRGQEHRGAGHAHGWCKHQARQEAVQPDALLLHFGAQQLAPTAPGAQHGEQHDAQHHREPATLRDLDAVGDDEGDVDAQEYRAQRQDEAAPFRPQRTRHDGQQQCVDQHGAGHRDAVSHRKLGGTAEAQHQPDDDDHHHPVDAGDVDLADGVVRGVLDGHARDVTQLHGLAGNRETTGDHRLRGDDRGRRGQYDHRHATPFGHADVEWIADRFRVFQDQRALPQVVQHQAGQHEPVPGQADGLGAEMAHVGVQRLATGDCQHDRAEDQDAVPVVLGEEVVCPPGIDGMQHFRFMQDVDHPQYRQAQEPDNGDGTEHLADLLRAEALGGEQRGQHHHGQWHDPVPHLRGHDFDALDGRQHRYRRRDDAIAEEQRSAEHPEDTDQVGRTPPLGQGALGQRHQRHDAALAIVVGAHDDGHVFQRDHDGQRPEHQRQDAQHGVMVGLQAVVPGEHLLQRVQRAGTDVAEDHADGADDQSRQSDLAVAAGGFAVGRMWGGCAHGCARVTPGM